MLIALSNGGWMQVDEEDYLDLIDQGDWYQDDDGYARRTIKKRYRKPGRTCLKVHQYLGQLMGFKEQVDHINGDRLDNRRSNLREATTQQNSMNRKTTKGGTYKARNGWQALIMVNGESKYLGYFKTKEEAKAAYMAASKALRGDWHRK